MAGSPLLSLATAPNGLAATGSADMPDAAAATEAIRAVMHVDVRPSIERGSDCTSSKAVASADRSAPVCHASSDIKPLSSVLNVALTGSSMAVTLVVPDAIMSDSHAMDCQHVDHTWAG